MFAIMYRKKQCHKAFNNNTHTGRLFLRLRPTLAFCGTVSNIRILPKFVKYGIEFISIEKVYKSSEKGKKQNNAFQNSSNYTQNKKLMD